MSLKTIIDSDVLSAIMRHDAKALARAKTYLGDYVQLTISLITRFEILRGLKAKRANARATKFDQFCASCEILILDNDIIVTASDIYADLYRRGALIGDADILIAATAIRNNLTLATNNSAHFVRITDLQIDNWSQ